MKKECINCKYCKMHESVFSPLEYYLYSSYWDFPPEADYMCEHFEENEDK